MKLTTLFITLLFLFLFNDSGLSQDYINYPDGDLVYLETEDIKQNEKKGGFYNEFWNYHISLENGAEIYLTYSISHFGGMRGAVSGARLSLLNWNGKDYSAAREYSLDKLVFDEETYQFKLNKERGIWFEGKLPENHKVHFHTNKKGTLFNINLNFLDAKPGVTWGDGVFKLGDNDEAGIFTHIPSSKIKGFVAINGDTVQVTGIGFMDHMYQTNVGTRLFKQSFRFSKTEGNQHTNGYFLIPKKGKTGIVGYALTSLDDGSIILKKPTTLEIRATKKYFKEKVASAIEVCYENSPCDVFEVQEMNEKIAMLDELRGLKKTFAKRFLGGDIIEMRGNALQNNQKKVFFSLTKLD